MDQKFINKMNQALLDLKEEIISNMMTNNEDFKQIIESMEPKDVADIASDDIDRKMIEAMDSQDMNRLKQIESALSRIEQGKYGICLKCGKKIPKERLDALPYAVLCIACKTEDERRNR